MATSLITNSQLQLIFDDGVDLDGNTIYKNKNFNNVKTDATPTQLYQIANMLTPLQQRPLASIERNDTKVLMA